MKQTDYYLMVALLAICHTALAQGESFDWGPESNSVKMSISVDYVAIAKIATAASPAFSLDGINDVSGFIMELQQQSNAISKYLWQRLSQEEQLLFTNYQSSSANANLAQQSVVRSLNRIVYGPCIYKYDRFQGVLLDEQAKHMTQVFGLGFNQEPPSGQYISHLNRLLLEDAYPEYLSPKPKSGKQTLNVSEPVILTIAFTNTSDKEMFYLPTVRGVVDDDRFGFDVITPSGARISPRGDPTRALAEGAYPLDSLHYRKREFSFNLSDICKFDEIGSYTINATREVDWPSGTYRFFRVASNPLTISVVPAAGK
jgi:hypothetical protein